MKLGFIPTRRTFFLTPALARTQSEGAEYSAAQNLFSKLKDRVVQADVKFLWTTGFTTDGVGGARYVRTTKKNASVYCAQSRDGAWWELAEKQPSLEMFGAMGGKNNDTRAIQAALDYLHGSGGGILTFDRVHVVRPSKDGMTILRVPSNVRLTATSPEYGVRVDDDAGNYGAVFGDADESHPSHDVVFENFTIHQNARGNSTCSVQPYDREKTLAAVRMGGSRIAVRFMIVQDAPGINTILLNGRGTRQCEAIGCKVYFLKGTSSLATYDNSAFYIHGDGWRLESNECYNLGRHGEARTAYEGHGKNYVIRGNRSFDYCLIANVVGEEKPSQEYTNVSVEDNEGINVRGGILLWAPTGSFLKKVSLRRNKAFCRPDLFPSSEVFLTGFGVTFTPEATGDFDCIESADNFHFSAPLKDGRPGSGSAGFQWETTGNIGLVSRNDVTIGAPNIGISVYSHRGKSTVEIRDATVQDAGSNPLAGIRQAIIFRGVCEGYLLAPKIIDTGVSSLNGLNGVSLNFLAPGSDLVFRPRPCTVANHSKRLLPNWVGPYVKAQNVLALTEAPNVFLPFSGGHRAFELKILAPSVCVVSADSHNTVEIGATINIKITASAGPAKIIWSKDFRIIRWEDVKAGQTRHMFFEYDGQLWHQLGD
jgi:hypothetical protein